MDENTIFRIRKDNERASDLLIMAEERLDLIKLIPKDKVFKVIEEYYEILKELFTAIMYADGFKTLSHVKLIVYVAEHYKEFDEQEIKLVDTLRKFRNGIVYYGKKISQDFLTNHEQDIQNIISKTFTLAKKKIQAPE